MPDDERIRDEAKVAAYIASARELYVVGTSTAAEIADPPVVLKTPTGAQVLAWLRIEDEDLTTRTRS